MNIILDNEQPCGKRRRPRMESIKKRGTITKDRSALSRFSG